MNTEITNRESRIQYLSKIKRSDYKSDKYEKPEDEVLALLQEIKTLEMQEPKEPNSAEVLIGFLGWLTSREETVCFSAYHDASVAVELFTKFAKTNNLPEIRENYFKILNHPS